MTITSQSLSCQPAALLTCTSSNEGPAQRVYGCPEVTQLRNPTSLCSEGLSLLFSSTSHHHHALVSHPHTSQVSQLASLSQTCHVSMTFYGLLGKVPPSTGPKDFADFCVPGLFSPSSTPLLCVHDCDLLPAFANAAPSTCHTFPTSFLLANSYTPLNY